MPHYRKLLVAVDLHDDGRAVLDRACQIAQDFGATLTVLHVVEYLPVDPAGDALLATPIDLTRERAAHAETRLGEWCDGLKIAPSARQVCVGAITQEIIRVAQELQVDLIVVGHPARTGLAAWFSHTEEGVVQRAPCDVLSVSLPA